MGDIDVLIIAAHHDDETIGCSSYILDEHLKVGVLIASKDDDVYFERKNVIKKLGLNFYRCLDFQIYNLPDIKTLADSINLILNELKPKIVLTHSRSDLHQDHIQLTKAVDIVVRMNRQDFIKKYLHFYTENPIELTNCKFRKIDKIEKKKMLEKYQGFIPEEHRNLIMDFNKFCGSFSGLEFAEPFKVIYER